MTDAKANAAMENEIVLKKRYRRMARCLARFIPGDPGARYSISSPRSICQECGLEYGDHPVCANGVLHVTCDGRLWKL